METTIFRTIKGSQMEQLFEAEHPDISIKYYSAINVLESEYSNNKKYKFEILIRHGEGTNADELFDKAFCKLFPTKIKRMRIFIYSINESKRSNKTGSTYVKANVYEIKNNLPKLIDMIEWSTGSFKGEQSAVMNHLGNIGVLPKKYAEKYYYDFKDRNFNILAV